MGKRTAGRPARYVIGPNGRTVVGLSFDKGNGTYYYSHWKSDGYLNRPNFGTDETLAIIKFREWSLKQQNKTTIIDGLMDRPVVDQFIDLRNSEEIERSKNAYRSLGLTQEVAVDEAIIWQKARELIAKDKFKAQELLGINFNVNEADVEASKITLDELIQRFENQPHFQDENVPLERKKDLKVAKKIWASFCRVIGKPRIGQITKSDIVTYHRKVISQFHRGYSTTWVHKQFAQVIRVLKSFVDQNENVKDVEQVRAWCKSVFQCPPMVIKNPAKQIKPAELNALLEASNPFERVVFLTALNCAYYPVDICSAKMDMVDFRDKTIVFPRGKTTVNRSAVLWDETIEAIQNYRNTLPDHAKALSPLFVNPETRKPFSKGFIGHLFGKVLKKAIASNSDLNIRKRLVFSNLRDSFRTACKVDGQGIPGIEGSAMAVMGHKPRNEIEVNYIDPEAYPTIAKAACKVVHDHYFPAAAPCKPTAEQHSQSSVAASQPTTHEGL